MVFIVDDWGVLEEYAGERYGFYKLLIVDGTVEIRVQTGDVGFKKEFANREDPLYNKILNFCRKNRFINVSHSAKDEIFFK